MPAVTVTWDSTKPANTRSARLGDDDIREFKTQIEERMRSGGHRQTVGTGLDDKDGRHECGVEYTAGGDSAVANEWNVYEAGAADGDFAVSIRDSGHATDASVLEAGDGIDGSKNYTIRAQTIEGYRTVTMAVPLPAITTGRVPGVVFENRGNGTMKLLEARPIAMDTAPAGSNLVIQMVILANTYTDPAIDAGTDVFAGGNEPTVTAGNKRGAAASTIADAQLEVGEAWVFELDSVGSTTPAAGTVLMLKVQRPNA